MLNNILSKQHSFIFLLVCILVPWFLPAIAQPADYHNFADTRLLLGIPNFSDVLSNIGFILGGVFCLALTYKQKAILSTPLFLSCLAVGAGAVLTGIGSGYYHLNPTNSTLVWDRVPMTITFAGLLAMMAYQLNSARFFTTTILWTGLVYGMCSVIYWAFTDNLTPYLILQFGGLIWLLISAIRTTGAQLLNWYSLLGCYVLAKIAEQLDVQLFELFQHIISGHSLKHLIASIGLIIAIVQLRTTIHNKFTVPA